MENEGESKIGKVKAGYRGRDSSHSYGALKCCDRRRCSNNANIYGNR